MLTFSADLEELARQPVLVYSPRTSTVSPPQQTERLATYVKVVLHLTKIVLIIFMNLTQLPTIPLKTSENL